MFGQKNAAVMGLNKKPAKTEEFSPKFSWVLTTADRENSHIHIAADTEELKSVGGNTATYNT